MATRTISGTLDTLEHEGTEITYKGSTVPVIAVKTFVDSKLTQAAQET